MTYSIYDANGYVGDLASTNGLREMRDYLQSIEASKIQRLLSAGYEGKSDELLTEINAITLPNSPSVRNTVDNFVALVNKCDEIIIITDGVFDGSENLSKNKGLNLQNEGQKAAHWKRIDRRRQGWWAILQKKFLILYEDMGEKVAASIGGKSEKQHGPELAARAKAAIHKLATKWESLIGASAYALVEDFGKEVADAIGVGVFDPTRVAIRSWLKQHAAENVKSILDTQKEAMGKLIAKGVEDNLSTTQIAKSIREFYDTNAPYLSMRVARSEVATASGYGSIAAAEQSGVADNKTWLSSRDDRVRDSHQAIDGETVPMGENFSNGLEYPGDQRGDPAESIACRCVLTFHSK